MPNPHAAPVVEVDDFRRFAKAQQVRGYYTMLLGERGNIAFPTDFGTGAEFAAMQQHHWVAAPASR
ncbi:hypothetical protein I552_2166 [Mycobacterium xenopi 3993]|nr:hypothetical protein I552_2166 [Mycobacterium xenopi 3993]